MFSLILAFALTAQWGPQTLQPRTYASPSGEWNLSVDPSSKLGDGKSQVLVTRRGESVWKAELPFTFWEALITDAGHAAGYAFTDGWSRMAASGEVVVAILGPDGKSLLEERVERTGSSSPDGPPNPQMLGIFAQPWLDRFVVRVDDPDVSEPDESWWSYRLSNGEKLGRERPKHALVDSEPLRWAMDARAIVDTPLTLVQWYSRDWREAAGHDLGTRFVLVDGDWKAVWTLALPKDYCHPDEDTEDRQLDSLRSTSGILAADAPGRFELRQVVENARVTFEVRADPAAPTGWSVREGARAPYVERREEPEELPVLALRKLASVPLKLGAPPSRSPVREIESFDFDAAGNVRFVRREKDGAVSLVSLDERGNVVREVRVEPLAPGVAANGEWNALRGERWLYSLSPYGDGGLSRAWIVESASGAAREIEGFSGPDVDTVAAAPDGGFVVLGTYWHRYTLTEALIAFDETGQRRWELSGNLDTQDDAALFSPDDIALDVDGSVLVLDRVTNRIQVFGADGKFVRKLDLEQLWGEQQRYLTNIRVEPSGTWLVHDFHDVKTWLRIDRQGQRLASFVPRRENGSTEIGRSDAARVDAAGRLWGTDGDEVYVIDDVGIARTRFGAPPSPTTLVEPSGVFLDGRGRVALADRRSHAVHLFGADGARQIVLVPAPTDFDDVSSDVEAVVAAPDGSVYVKARLNADRYLVFAADGRSSGWTKLGGERIAFLADGERWAASCSRYEASFVRRLAADGTERTRIERRPGNEFFTEILGAGCAPDGALAVLTPAEDGLELDLFDASGVAQRAITIRNAPRGWWDTVRRGARWVLISSNWNEALLVSLPDGKVSLVRATDGAAGTSYAFELSADGKELWCATLEPPALHRFALPE